ncbi:MAG: late competence development ComFB family protein [Pseudanabaenaceae cyanobacterium bins.68]|nr:late competence development ComFB family protein [Pseudanabaenaceae cyanobacterium bins.68]
MESCRNFLLDLVVQQVEAQAAEQGGRLQQPTSKNEIIVYALNQLPPIYVATEKDWQIQVNQPLASLRTSIEDAVCYAIENLWINPFRTFQVHPAEQELPALTLLRLQKLLGQETLTWRQLPETVQNALEYRTPTTQTISPPFSAEYLSYMLPARLNCYHALRLPVTRLAIEKLNRFPPEVIKQVRIEEIVAMALSQLPPMYASNTEDLLSHRQRAKQELGTKFERIVDLAVQSARKEFFNQGLPLLFHQIKAERRQAMSLLKRYFQSDQVNWRTCGDFVENALGEVKEQSKRR